MGPLAMGHRSQRSISGPNSITSVCAVRWKVEEEGSQGSITRLRKVNSYAPAVHVYSPESVCSVKGQGWGSHLALCPQPELRPLTQPQPSLCPPFLVDLLHRDENPEQKVISKREVSGDESKLFEKLLKHQRFLKASMPGRVGTPLPVPYSHTSDLATTLSLVSKF